ncbi:MAG: universal stress protein [Burkholderiales bacterium]
MTYRSIFVHVDDSDQTDLRLEAATRLARHYPAELTGAYIVSTRDLTPTESALLPADLVKARMGTVAQAQKDAEHRFRKAASAAGIKSVQWRAPAGDPVDAAVMQARYSDLAVVGQPVRKGPDAAFSAELANAVVMDSGRPVLFVPYIGAGKTLGERILIAWKDSRESARAVADALPFLKDAKAVLAIAVEPRDEESVQDYVSDKAVEGFLRRHDVDATVNRMVAPDIASGEFLLSRAADFGADLIVMGGYSRPRLSRLVWGGVSNLMLESMTVPVLMSH